MLCGWTQNGNQPAFILNKSGNHHAWTRFPGEGCAGVGLRTASGKKKIARLQLPEVQNQFAGGGKMIGAPSLVRFRIATDRAAEQVAFVRIRVMVLVVEIQKRGAEVLRDQHLR